MKKIYYLIALMAVAAGFTACNPMNETYKQLDASPTPNPKTLTYTLLSTDYALGGTGNTTGSFTNTTDANTNIPKILNAKFPYGYDNGSNAVITYNNPSTTIGNIKVADSLYTDVTYTVTAADYTAAATATGTTFKDYSDAQVLLFLKFKYPNAVANQLSVLTYTYYASGITPSAGVAATDSFLFLNGAWTKLYTVSPAQYAAAGRGSYNEFVAADAANLPTIFNTFLKNDPTVASTAKVGDVKYVSYNYYASKDYQRVMALAFDGANWSTKSVTTTSSLSFVKSNGVWVQDPTVYYTAVTKDFTYIGTLTSATLAGATASAISNYAKYGDFTTSSTSAYYWSPAQIDAAMIAILKFEFPTAKTGIPYRISYLLYSGSDTVASSTFKFDGTNWVKQ